MNIKINDINKKYVIINKNKSIFSIKFLNSNKNLNFNEIKSGIYIFNKNNIICLFDKIKSNYIIFNIFSYIKYETLLKLIKYSKYVQKKLDINILNYKEKYLKKRFNYEDFLFIFEDFYEKSHIRKIFLSEQEKFIFLKEKKNIKKNMNYLII